MSKKRKFPIEFKFLFMNHWGDLYILPSLQLSITYSMPTFIFNWWVFRMDIIIWKHLPDWFMKYVWSFLNLDFIKKKEKDEFQD